MLIRFHNLNWYSFIHQVWRFEVHYLSESWSRVQRTLRNLVGTKKKEKKKTTTKIQHFESELKKISLWINRKQLSSQVRLFYPSLQKKQDKLQPTLCHSVPFKVFNFKSQIHALHLTPLSTPTRNDPSSLSNSSFPLSPSLIPPFFSSPLSLLLPLLHLLPEQSWAQLVSMTQAQKREREGEKEWEKKILKSHKDGANGRWRRWRRWRPQSWRWRRWRRRRWPQTESESGNRGGKRIKGKRSGWREKWRKSSKGRRGRRDGEVCLRTHVVDDYGPWPQHSKMHFAIILWHSIPNAMILLTLWLK